MNIVVGSAFRNASGYVMRYLNQIVKLKVHAGAGHRVRVIAVEGDSTDTTHNALAVNSVVRNVDLQIVKCDHGGRWFGSVEDCDRMSLLSKVGNAIFDAVREDDDVLFYVESDLLWDPNTAGSLIDMAMRQEEGFDIFSPMIYAGEMFYDTWAFRKNGIRFEGFPPYHPEFAGRLIEMDSVGSCLAMRGEVARSCRIRNRNALVGWCEDARANGFRIAVHPGFRVNHP